jgi:hypothetical protein
MRRLSTPRDIADKPYRRALSLTAPVPDQTGSVLLTMALVAGPLAGWIIICMAQVGLH